jgi:type I restriction enzyme M protein
MSRALRDSDGGGIMERFESVSKLLFTKMVDEREANGGWNGLRAKPAEELVAADGATDRVLYERARAIWQRAVSAYPKVFSGSRSQFPADVVGVARIIRILESVSLAKTSEDVKGAAYEELLRNTFEKNENQQYFTPRHVVDFMVELMDPTVKDIVCDPAAGSGGFLVGALAYIQRSGQSARKFTERMRGAEVDERMAWIARINMLLHGGDPRSIFHLTGPGSLAPVMQVRNALPTGTFSLILTNPPFGSDLTDDNALASFKTGRGRTSRRRGILFIERCLDLLAPGGRLAIVLDDSALNLPTNEDIRELVRRTAIVEAVISLPDVTFMPYSTAKSSILVLRRRKSAEKQGLVFMADVENVGNRPNGDPLYSDERDELGRRKLKSDLPSVAERFGEFTREGKLKRRLSGAGVFAVDIDEYLDEPGSGRLDVFFFHPTRKHARELLAHSAYPLVRLGDLIRIDGTAVAPAVEYGDGAVRWIGLSDIEAQTGRFEVRELSGDRIKSTAHLFSPGDVLFSRLRPKLRKVVRIPTDDEGGLCSAELLVLRTNDDGRRSLDVDFLAYILRSELVFGQLFYQITGIGRPRIGIDAIRNLTLPVPPLPVQRQLLRELVKADREADRLRADAQRKLEAAVRLADDAFEKVIRQLCPDDQPRAASSSVGVGSVASPSAARRTASA